MSHWGKRHWTVMASRPGGRGLNPVRGCFAPTGPMTTDPDAVTCPVCKCLPSYMHARAEAEQQRTAT